MIFMLFPKVFVDLLLVKEPDVQIDTKCSIQLRKNKAPLIFSPLETHVNFHKPNC